jgi:hypothetical protein
MVVRIEQNSFVSPSEREVSSHPLVIHGRPGPRPDSVVVLVHGWNGDRYLTWGHLPALLFTGMASCDIGLYGFASGAKRLSRRKLSVTMDLQAEHLAHTLRDLPYRKIAVVGHSMGGMLSGWAIVNLVDSQTRWGDGPACTKLAGLFLCATPQAGTTRVPSWVAWLTEDFRLLRIHSTVARDVSRRFSDRITAQAGESDKVYLPVFALVGAADRVVDAFSAGLALPSDRIKVVMKNHRSLVKPDTADDEGFVWLRDRLLACVSHVPSRSDRQPSSSPAEGVASGKSLTDESRPAGQAPARSSQGSSTVTFEVRAARDAYAANEMTVHHHGREDADPEGSGG